MKMRCSITAVADHGDKMELKLQGAGVKESPMFGRLAAQTLEVPNDTTSRKAFYVGRLVTVEVKPVR